MGKWAKVGPDNLVARVGLDRLYCPKGVKLPVAMATLGFIRGRLGDLHVVAPSDFLPLTGGGVYHFGEIMVSFRISLASKSNCLPFLFDRHLRRLGEDGDSEVGFPMVSFSVQF